MLDDAKLLRYSRQLSLPAIGFSGQEKISNAKVLVVGAGGLGGPVCLYLTAAGVGVLDICDYDKVELTNLNRQIQFTTAEIGAWKSQVTANKCLKLNQDTKATAISMKIQDYIKNPATRLYDLVLDCSDNFAARYCIGKYCSDHSIPLVSVAIQQFQMQLIALDHQHNSACYSCIFQPDDLQQNQNDETDGCSQTGVLGACVGAAACLQAQEALLFLASGELQGNQTLRMVDMLTLQQTTFNVSIDPVCLCCQVASAQ